MIQQIFDKLGGHKAVQSFMEKKYPSMYREAEPSMRERSQEGSSLGNSMRQSSVVAKSVKGGMQTGTFGLQVKSQVTNTERPVVGANGMIQPFDQVMSNFAMYGLANRH